MNQNEPSSGLKSLRIRYGGYSIVGIAVILAVVLLLNFGVRLLPSSVTKLPTDGRQLYSISETSRTLSAGVSDPITFYLLGPAGGLNGLVENYVRRYADLNPNFTVKTVDLAVRPAFLSSYTDETVSASETNVLLVNEKNGRSRLIPYSKIYYQLYTTDMVYYYYMYYGVELDNPLYFGLEDELVSAVDYLTTSSLPIVYCTSGHGETVLDETLKTLVGRENVTLSDLPLATAEAVPDDAAVVLIAAPTKDFSEDEIARLSAFADRGGNLILISRYRVDGPSESRNLSNLYTFASEYGIAYHDALVLEGNGSRYDASYGPLWILPLLAGSEYDEAVAANTSLLMAYCHPLILSDSAQALLTTTLSGYLKETVDETTQIAKTENDPEGSYTLAAIGTHGNSRLVWASSLELIDSATVSRYSNISYFLSILTALCEKERAVTVEALALQIESLSVSQSAASVWSVILIGVIPITVLLIGAVIWRRRAKR